MLDYKDQFNALVSGIVASKEMVENAPKLTNIVLGNNVTCDRLAAKAQGNNVTCDNDAMIIGSESSRPNVLEITLPVRMTIKALAAKAQGLNCLWLGNNVTCDNVAMKALAAKALAYMYFT